MNKIKYIAAVLIGIAGLGLQQAKADTFLLTSDHCTGGCGPAPYGSVTLTQVGTSVQVLVSIAPNSWASTGAGDFQLFKFNDATISLGDIVVNQTFAGQTLEAQTGNFNGDGTGNFTFGIACITCGNGNTGITTDISFTVNNTTLAALETRNNLGNIFVADIFSAATGNTGPVDASEGMVPDGGTTVMLLGMALGALGMVRRYLAS